MQINNDGINIIKSYEGLEDGDPSTVNLDPYVCPAGIWTIGYGHAIFYNGRMLKKKNPGDEKLVKSIYPNGITIQEAESLLKTDLEVFNKQVSSILKVELNTNQFSALISFTYNIGIGKVATSTLLNKINSADFIGAAAEFPKWRRSNGVILNGLVKRRESERLLFIKRI